MESLHIGNDKTFNPLLQRMSIVLLPLLLLMMTTGTLSPVNASSDDSVSCYERGIIDGGYINPIKEHTITVEIGPIKFY